MSERLFVGLGNPGEGYAKTRHNMGFLILEAFAEEQGWTWKEQTRLCGWTTRGMMDEDTVHLLRPSTYMNESGQSVRRYLDYYKIASSDSLIVYDDTALPFGDMRLREKGGSGGHKGLESIFKHLGTRQIPRLRVGIGHQGSRSKADYVLDAFTSEERESLPQVIKKAVQVLHRLLAEPKAKVMNEINQKLLEKNDDSSSEESLRGDVHHQRQVE